MLHASNARYGAYHRISQLGGRDLEAESTISDKVAFEQMDGWASMRGVEPPKRYLDTDKSGSKMSRPALDQMLADLEAGVIQGVIVAQVDRLSRADVGDALAVVKEIIGVTGDGQPRRPLVLLDLGIDPSTEFGEFGLTILLGLARMQWRRYQRQWATARGRALKRKLWIGPLPFGYVRTQVRNERGDLVNGPLAEHPTEGPIVREMFRLAASEGLHAAAFYLLEQVPERRWRTSDVRRMVAQRVYLGENHPGNPEAHPALTELRTFTAAQTDPRARRGNGEYPLSGLATCQTCDGPMVGALQTVRGTAYRRMRCSNVACKGGCSINADRLEEYVREELAREIPGYLLALEHQGGDEQRLARELADAEERLNRWAADTDRERRSPVAYLAGLEQREADAEAARVAYAEAATEAERVEEPLAADQLHVDGELARAVRATGAVIVIRRGRGTLAERVGIDYPHRALDGDDGAGAAAAA